MIIHASFSDGDASLAFNTLTYSISPAIAPFAMDATTGQLYVATAGVLDFETTTSYSTVATISDGTSTDFTISIDIQVTGQRRKNVLSLDQLRLSSLHPALISDWVALISSFF